MCADPGSFVYGVFFGLDSGARKDDTSCAGLPAPGGQAASPLTPTGWRVIVCSRTCVSRASWLTWMPSAGTNGKSFAVSSPDR
jgi:hypothetical protein